MKLNNKSNHDKEADPFVIREGSFKEGNFHGKFRREWVEATFSPGEHGEDLVTRSVGGAFMGFVKIALFLVAFILLSRLGWLQIVKGEYYKTMADGNRIRLDRLEATRGIIYDRNNLPLVHNVANFLIYSIPSDLPKEELAREKVFKRLEELLDKDITVIREEIDSLTPADYEYYQPIFIADNIPYEKALAIYLESFSTPGITVESKHRRQYELSSLSLSHVLGYTGTVSRSEFEANRLEYSRIDSIGKSGVEKSWEKSLRGQHGSKQIEVDALGKEKQVISSLTPIPGQSLILSIDSEAQKKLEEILFTQLSSMRLTKGVAIALDPRNGEVIALVSLPSYDNNLFAGGIGVTDYKALIESPDKPLFNRAVQGEYPSGSTVKPVVAAAALQEGIITANTSFLSTGGLRIGQWSFPDWRAGGHGQTNVTKAIAESVNTFFYHIGGGYDGFNGLGIDKLVQWFLRFNLGKPLGLDLPGEAIGFVPTKEWKEFVQGERWYIGDTYHIAIGQGNLITTPMQVAAWTAFFANGGKIYQPRMVKSLIKPNGEVEEIPSKVLVENIVDSQHVETVKRGLRQTAVSGSAASLSTLPVEAAGKTGTAQWSSKKAPHAWFTGFAPYNNPELVITVLIEEGEEGSRVATPVAREFLRWYFGDREEVSEEEVSDTEEEINEDQDTDG